VLSSSFPSIELSFFFFRHRSSGNRKPFAIGKLDHNTKQVPARTCLSEDIVDRVLASGSGAPDPSFTETYFFDLFRSHLVSGDMFNPILRPKQLIDQHRLKFTMRLSYRQVGVSRNASVKLKFRQADRTNDPAECFGSSG
jgi:hypothetical protein